MAFAPGSLTSICLSALIASCLIVLYAYVGYPVVLRAISFVLGDGRNTNRFRYVLTDTDCPNVVVLIVAHNEAKDIARKIAGCLAQDYPRNKLRVLIVSDGSTDNTAALVRGFVGARVQLIENSLRKGKAACINLAMDQISEEFVVFADARQRLSGTAVRNLISNFQDPEVGGVTGELKLERSEGDYWFERGVTSYWQREVELRRLESRVHSVVGATGALYALRKAAFTPIPDHTILDDVLIPMNAVLSGYRIRYESRAHAFDRPVSDLTHERQRKVRTLAGNFQLIAVRRQLLNPLKNPIFLQFVSHKLMRLLVPLAMLTAFASCLVLSGYHWVFGALLAVQVAAYILATLPERFLAVPAIGAFRVVRTFVVMHWFVILGFKEFLMNRNAHLWTVSSPPEPQASNQ